MFVTAPTKNSLEILEARIAPASVIATSKFIPAIAGGATFLQAGEGLGTSTQNSGTYLLYVEQGDCLVFTTDFNNNGAVDFNEITGIAAGDGLRLISFVNINGDIVTNLRPNGTLSDSDNNTSNDDPFLKGDGRVVLNTTIEKIELRSLTTNDLIDQNGDGSVDDFDVSLRLALSSYSIFGTVYAGKGFGLANDASSGLIIDDTGRGAQQANFGFGAGADYFIDFKPSIGAIKTGTATSGEYFSFDISRGRDTQGLLTSFAPPIGQAGGDIVGVRAVSTATAFDVDAIIAGDGGAGARGGNIVNVTLNADSAGGYIIQAGNGGRGINGGVGGSIVNFQDFSSFTSQIVLHSGDGGVATTGAGGNGGNISFGTLNVNGGLGITLGSGGDGFTAGGNGASLTKAVITTPEGTAEYASVIVSSVHDPLHDPVTGLSIQPGTGPGTLNPAIEPATGIIGRSLPLDFNHDGFGDMVYTSRAPDQLVVDFGDGLGGFTTAILPTADGFSRLYLSGVNIPDALAVGDFNGDGYYDIAVGSHATGNFGGVEVFLAKTEDLNQDGVLTKAEDLNHDGIISFLGFQSPRYTPLPSLQTGDPDGGPATSAAGFYGYYRAAVPIADLEVGDFNGDGITDLAVGAIYTAPTPTGPGPFGVAVFMTPNIENGRPTGQFYADVGTKAIANPPQGANPFIPFRLMGGGTDAALEATSLGLLATHDVLVGNTVGAGAFVRIMDDSVPGLAGPRTTNVDLPIVDTDRGIPGVAFVRPNLRELVISDINEDGFADLTALSENPAGYLVAALGDGTVFNAPLIGGLRVENTGVYFPDGAFQLSTSTTAVRLFSFDQAALSPGVTDVGGAADGQFDEIMVSFADAPTVVFDVEHASNGFNGDEQLWNFVGDPGGRFNTASTRDTGLDVFFPDITNTPGFDTILCGDSDNNFPAGRGIIDSYVASITLAQHPAILLGIVPIAEHYVKLHAGDGGSALVGSGGIGGSLGDAAGVIAATDPVTGAVALNALDAINITLPVNIDFNGLAVLTAGNGGNGFTTGGKAGSVASVVIRYANPLVFHTEVSLFGGNGGFGVSGAGGSGGDLLGLSLQSGEFLTAGNGGRGAVGGNGGSIRGNGNDGLFDSEDLEMILLAGDGGSGIKAGGNGGDIVHFAGLFDLFFAGATGGILTHIAGDGGNAISGPGGRGGSVISSSPLPGLNNLTGDITLVGGHGGDGRSGGDGGSVLNFVDRPSTQDSPAVLSFVAGDGGRGGSGKGGKGGGIANLDSPSIGKPNGFSDLIFSDPRIPLQPYTFNRFLSGDGGKSAGGRGGDGGDVTNVRTSNSDNPFVAVSGAGGSGLFRGGNGGNLLNMEVNVGGDSAGTSISKALIIAGAGGSAAAWKPNPLDTGTPNQGDKFFGGRLGKPGNGGNILNLTQTGAISARVDLIAGNGGDLINYGLPGQTSLPVGKGGSINNVDLAGNIGNITPNIPFKSYNDVFAGQTLQEFVSINLRDPLVPGSFDDNAGMVGLVAGAAGRIKEAPNGFDGAGGVNYRSLPADNGVNGSVLGLSARNIAAMVAGAVERIAAIRVVSGIDLKGGGVLGKDFDDNIDPAPYRDPDGNSILEPVLDGRLVDGALIYTQFKKFVASDGTVIDKLPPGGRNFQLGQAAHHRHHR